MKKLLFFLLIPFFALAQWTENFDAGTIMPVGWATINNNADSNEWLFGAPYTTGTAQSGNNVATIHWGATAHDDYLITKAITVQAGVSDRISFYVKSESASVYLENYNILLSTTNQTVGAFTTTLQATQKAPAAWTKLTFNLTAYVGQTIYVAVHATDTDQFFLYADSFVVDALPSCTAPTAVTSSTITTTSANLSWTGPATTPTNGYQVYYNTSNTAPTSATTPTVTGITGTSIVISPLTSGTTYYAWVRSACTATNTSDWAPYTFATKPVNDDCANSITLTVNPSLPCAATTAGSTVGATDSSVAVTPCTGTADDDVWYKFVATNTAHTITLSNVVSTGATSSTSLYTQILSGACGTLANVACGTTNVTSLTGLTLGQTYYVRAYNSNDAGYSNSFNICVGTPPPPPANDVCSGAIALTAGGNFAANAVVGSTISATTDGTTTCQSNRGNNVWYSVIVPASGSLTIETKLVAGSPLTDTVLSVHGGTCGGTFTDINCDDDAGDDNFSKVSLTGQTPGATLYVSVWRYTNNSSNLDGQFQLSAYDASISLATTEVSDVKNAIKAYPNPFADVLNISDVKDVKSVSVIDIAGRLVKTIEKPNSALQLGEFKSGMYVVVLNMIDGSKQTIKAIKK